MTSCWSRWVCAVVIVGAVGCLHESAEVCRDGSVCPAGFQCVETGAGSGGQLCAAGACGNGRLDPGEVCDDGNNRSGDGCPADCTAACGDGVRDPGEACDDGNTTDGDGCAADCLSLDSVFQISPATVSFAVAEGDPPPALEVSLRLELRNDDVLVGYAPGVPQPTWLAISDLVVSPTTATFRLRVTDTSIVGDHSTSVRLTISHENSSGLQTFDLPVSYHVAASELAVTAAPDALTFNTVVGTTAFPSQPLTVTFNGDRVALVTKPSWLTVTSPPDLATSPAAFTAAVNTSFAAGTSLSEDLVFVATRGSAQRMLQVPVRYNVLELPEITSIDRLALVPGRPGSVMVYGTGFLGIPHPSTDLRVAGATPTAVTVLGDRALRVELPALPAGEYPVSLRNDVGVESRQLPLSVLAPIDRVHEEIPTEGTKFSLVWDAISQSAYVVNVSLELVMRFDLSHTPATVTAKRIGSVVSLGLPLDRSVILAGVTDGAGTLHDLDPGDLSTIRTRATGGRFAISDSPMPISGGNLAWIQSFEGRAYNLARSAPATAAEQNGAVACYFCASSPDGRRMIFNQDPTSFPGPPLAWWDAAEGATHFYTTSSVGVFYAAPSDHAGTRWILDFRVFDFDFSVLGVLDVPDPWTALRYALSRSGRRAYVYADNGGDLPKVFVYDTTGPLITTTSYPLLGSIDVAALASCPDTDGPGGCSRYRLGFRITDDERTLLAIGDRRLLVIPIPAELQSP